MAVSSRRSWAATKILWAAAPLVIFLATILSSVPAVYAADPGQLGQAESQAASQSQSGSTCSINSGTLFGFPHWWQYLPSETDPTGKCVPSLTKGNPPRFDLMSIWAIGLAVLGMLLYLAGIVAVGSIIYAGVSYITAIGDPQKITSSRKRIQNSLIGLALVLISSALVSFIGNTLTQ